MKQEFVQLLQRYVHKVLRVTPAMEANQEFCFIITNIIGVILE